MAHPSSKGEGVSALMEIDTVRLEGGFHSRVLPGPVPHESRDAVRMAIDSSGSMTRLNLIPEPLTQRAQPAS